MMVGAIAHITVKALPRIITALKQQGYKFVTIPALLEIQAQNSPLTTTAHFHKGDKGDKGT